MGAPVSSSPREKGVTNAADVIHSRAPGLVPRVGIVLGSGLGAFADAVADPVVIPYGDLPGFPPMGVAGHLGRLTLGTVSGVAVAVMQGRAHFYEHGRADGMKGAVRTLAAIGCETLLLTNAAGSLKPQAGPGSIMMLTDHINFAGVSPLFDEQGSERFVDMTGAYDPALRALMHQAAVAEGIPLHEGVYAWFCGPHFETPAEIRAARVLGADAAGMSTVPEVILARQAKMRVVALSIITNAAAGMAPEPLSHEQTMHHAARAAAGVARLISAFLSRYA